MDVFKQQPHDAPTIYGLQPDIVPHRQWALCRWYSAGDCWFYHRRGTHEEISSSRSFYKGVDPELRELCHFLHDRGVRTTPSCQGHFHDRDHFEKVWEELRIETEKIVSAGLLVTDSESQQQYHYRNMHYRLPWESFEEFFDQAAAHQQTGFLGLIVPQDRESIWMTLQSLRSRDRMKHLSFDPSLSRALGGYVFDIFVRAENPEDRSTKWRTVTETIRRRLSP